MGELGLVPIPNSGIFGKIGIITLGPDSVVRIGISVIGPNIIVRIGISFISPNNIVINQCIGSQYFWNAKVIC